jgi:type IV secretory pathway TraG/TraD family ATPase VirD4
MNINANSFFFRRYLGYKAESTWSLPHPKSICDLVVRTFWRTVMFLTMLHVLWTSIYATFWLGMFHHWKRNDASRIMYFGDHTGTAFDLLIGMPAMLGQLLVTVVVIAGAIFAVAIGVVMASMWIWDRLPKRVHKTAAVIGDVTDSIRGKSCKAINIIHDEK